MKTILKKIIKSAKLVPLECMLAIVALLLALGSARVTQAGPYTNPVFNCTRDADVDLMWDKKRFYLTRPNGGTGGDYLSYSSPDLVNWAHSTAIFHQPSGKAVWKGHIANDTVTGTYYFYYTQVVGSDSTDTKVASASAPDSVTWNTNYSFSITNCIDPFLFKDDDGSLYLYYKHEVTGLDIWVQPMSSYTTSNGSPTLILTPDTTGWEACGEPQLEGTAAFKSGGVYYVLYTGGYDDTATCYGIGAAWSTNATGPFTKCNNNPFISYHQNTNVLSAGAPRVVKDGANQFWITYRTWPTPGTGAKYLSIDKLTVDNTSHELFATPTWGTIQAGPVPEPNEDDFSGNGVPDALTINTNTMTWNVRYSKDGSSHTFQFGTKGDVPFTAFDLDRDGLCDAVVYRPSNHNFYYRYSAGGSTNFAWGSAGDTPLMGGDFSGNGIAEPVTINPTTMVWNVRHSKDGSSHTFQFGSPGDIPFVAQDLDGDGLADAVVYRPSNQTFYYHYSSGIPTTSFVWGSAGDTPLMSSISMDGNGAANAITINPTTMVWNVRNSVDGSSQTFQFGNPGDIPFARGDLDRDGITDAVVYRPSDNTFYYHYSSGGTASFVWGAPGDKPVQ